MNNVFKLEALRRIFPEAKEALDRELHEELLSEAEIRVEVRKIDVNFLTKTPVEQGNKRFALYAVRRVKSWLGLSREELCKVPLTTKLEGGALYRAGDPILDSLEMIGKLKEVVRLVQLYIISDFHPEVPVVQITVLVMPPWRKNLSRYLEELFQKAQDELQIEIASSNSSESLEEIQKEAEED